MFGTLVISLPSRHEGGDVALRRHNEEGILNTSTKLMNYMFWCIDLFSHASHLRVCVCVCDVE